MRFLLTCIFVSLHLSLRQNLIAHFMLIWSVFLLLATVYGTWICTRYALPTSPAFEPHMNPGNTRLTRADGIGVALFLLFTAFYVTAIFYREDFAYYDDDMMTDFTLQGRPALVPIWPETGRFFPLAYRGFNVVRHLTSSPFGYHASVVVELVALLAVAFLCLKPLRSLYRLLILVAIMLAPSFIIPFTGFVYPERSVLLWLSVLVLCLLPSSQASAPRASAIGALVATQFVLYYKETAVVLVVAYAGIRILLEGVPGLCLHGSPRKISQPFALHLGMAAVYSVMFLAVVSSGHKLSYVGTLRQTFTATVFAYLQSDWLLIVFLAVCGSRAFRVFFFRDKVDPLWDSLAIGAGAYYLAIIGLRIYSPYYMAPADFIALLYVAHVAVSALVQKRRIVAYAVTAGFLAVVAHRALYSSFHMLERKDVISAKRQLADHLKQYLAGGNQGSVVLYFPYATGYRLMELSSYFRYKGLPLAGQQNNNAATVGLVIMGREHFDHNLCVPYRDYVCRHAETVPRGALIILMPDDDISVKDVEALGKDNIRLWSWRQCSFCSGENPWVEAVRGVSAVHPFGPVPSHWLLLDVFKRRADKESVGSQLAASHPAVL